MEQHHEIATLLLEIEAIKININDYFTWTSGIKSPIYCDNRLTLSYPHARNEIINQFVKLIENLDQKPDVIAGCATAGIPHAALIADRLQLPMVYVRTSAKSHGKGNQIEGHIEPGQHVVVIEDLISTGGSSIICAKALQDAGANVTKVLGIFSYELEQAVTNFSNAQLTYETITTYDDLLELLAQRGELKGEEKEELMKWRNELSLS